MRDLANRLLQPMALLAVWLATALASLGGTGRPAPPDARTAITDHPVVTGAEGVVMVTDRQIYIAGEHIWYSFHLTAAGSGEVPRSVAGYAELLNWSNMPVAQSRILLDGKGHGAGTLALPDTLSSGDYLLRGYTRAMLPHGPEKYFSKLVRVLNPYSKNGNYTLINLGQPPARRLELFAESGITVPGSLNRVVVKATGNDGKGRAVEVIIRGPGGTPTDTVVTDMTGLGSDLLLIPESGSLSATAMIDSVLTEAQLVVSGQMYHKLALEPGDGNSTRIGIIAPDRPARPVQWPLHLAVISPGRIDYYRQIPGNTSDPRLDIPAWEAGTGIFEALLYDSGGSLLSSRLFMTGGPVGRDGSDAVLVTGPGTDSVRITIPRGADYMSLSVALDGGDTPDIRTWSLLEPWLTAASINDPFLGPFLDGRAPLSDELMITLGGTGTAGSEGSQTSVMAETLGLAVTGTAINLQTLGPASETLFFLNIPGKYCFLQYARSDESGNFTFIVPPRTGTGEVVIYPQDTTANIILKISSPFSHDFLPMQHSTVKAGDVADAAALRMSVNSQVMRIYDIADTDTLPPYTDPAAGTHFYGSTGQHLLLSDYIPLPNMEEVFFELVPGVELLRSRDRYSFRIFDPQTDKEVKDPPLMFIDGTLTTDPETIAGLTPDRTESIDAVIMRYRIGELLLPPVISVITKKGDFRQQKLPQSALRINYLFTDVPIGFKPFAGNADARIPAYGNTLLWVAAPCGQDSDELMLRVPRPDYDNTIRISGVFFGSDRYPVFVSESGNLLRR
ncbi:hypothetical protein EG827_02240 [bacterium]|nr:hypothetical protein [bacterium]